MQKVYGKKNSSRIRNYSLIALGIILSTIITLMVTDLWTALKNSISRLFNEAIVVNNAVADPMVVSKLFPDAAHYYPVGFIHGDWSEIRRTQLNPGRVVF